MAVVATRQKKANGLGRMPDFKGEFFGKPDQIAIQKRSANLWRLLRDNPRFGYFGRTVVLTDPGDDTLDILLALAELQGAGVGYYIEKGKVQSLLAQIEAAGMSTDRHEQFRGGDEAIRASRAALGQYVLPTDLSVTLLDSRTPSPFVRAVAELWQSCEIMPVPGTFMRGVAMPGICIAAADRAGRVVGVAASFMLPHKNSRRAGDAFWGMLATRPDRRGERISLILGAQVMIQMSETHGARGFITGVRAENAASQALCARLGVHDTQWAYPQAINPGMIAGGKVTK